MSNLFSKGDQVKAMGAQGKVQESTPGTGVGDGLVLIRFADGTERYVTESYLKNENPAKKEAKKKAAPQVEAKVEAKVEEVELPKAEAPVKKAVPKAKAPAKKKATAKKVVKKNSPKKKK